MPLNFAGIGKGVQIGGKVVSAFIKKNKAKRAARKAARAAEMAREAEGVIQQKLSGIISQSNVTGVMDEKLSGASFASDNIKKVSRIPPYVFVLIGLGLLLFFFKRK